jgi:hypothetical protein
LPAGGGPSNNKSDEGIVRKAVEPYREEYCGFGTMLAREAFSERDGLESGANTLRPGVCIRRVMETEKEWQ